MGTMASQITSLIIVYSTIYWGVDQQKHQSSASQAFVQGINRWICAGNSPVTGEFPIQMASNAGECFHFDDVIMIRDCRITVDWPQSSNIEKK